MNPINFGNGASLFHWRKTSPSSGKSLESKAMLRKKLNHFFQNDW